MNVGDFEDAVWAIDGIRIVIRARRATQIGDFGWANAAPEGQSLTVYTRNRVRARIGNHEYCVIDGRGSEPHGRTLLRNVRQSYR
jgi:hypothetical protein